MKSRSFILITIIIILCFSHPVKAADKKISVASEDEFYTALSKQRLAHKTNQLYYIANAALKNKITERNGIFDSFSYHYNPKEPLASGCYSYLSIRDMRISWFKKTDSSINVEMHFYVPKDTMDSYYEEMHQIANTLKGKNDYESVKAVHDYIINRVEYDHASKGTNYTDIEGIRENKMVCQGYSMVTYVLLSDMGIPVRIVTGNAGSGKESGPHAWNIVSIDGKWYNYDATWDDAGGTGIRYDYFLKGRNDFPNHYEGGLFANEEFTSMISEESYHSPMELRDNIIEALPSLIFPLVVILLIYCYIKTRRSSNSVYPAFTSSSESYTDTGNDMNNDNF